ncbi:MAG: flagellar basal body L-ring protein FlgH [Candidatus Berkiella sp.]
MKTTLKIVLLVSTVTLGACSQNLVEFPNDPNFAPVIPERMPIQTPDMGSIYYLQQGTSLSLYEDIKAHHVGDLITVMLTEKTDATKKAENTYQKNDQNTTPEPTLFGISPPAAEWKFPKELPIPLTTTANLGLATNINSQRSFTGTADGKQNNKLSGTISVVVTQIYPNGNLFVRGEKWININDGNEYIRLSGIIRPEDVSPNNTIDSNRIADARISYSGTGTFANQNKQGWLTRFLSSPYWPI